MENFKYGRGFEPLFKAPSHQLSEVIPYREGVVTIIADMDKLRQDFLAEAQRRKNIDMALAEAMINRLKFFNDHRSLDEHILADLKRKNVDNKLFKTLEPVGKLSITLSEIFKNNQVLAAVYSQNEAPALLIDSKNIVAQASTLPSTQPEILETAIGQMTYSTWRHEREHLLRILEPKTKAVDRETKKKELMIKLVPSLVVLGGLSLLVNKTTGDPRLDALILTNLVVVPFSLSLTLEKLWYLHHDPAEKEARDQQKNGENFPGLFEFRFERNDNF